MILDQEKIARIKNLLKFKPKGMSISDISHNLKMNRNSVAKYLDLLLISGQVEMQSYGTAKVYFLSQRIPLSAMLTLSSDLVIIVDSDLRVIQVNENFIQAFGLNREVLIGNSVLDIPLPFIPELPVIDVINNSKTPQETNREIEFDRFGTKTFFRAKLVPTVFEEGTNGITIIFENITEKKVYEQQLRVSEARYRSVVEDQTEFICRFLPDGTHLFVNEAYLRYFQKTKEEIIDRVFIPEVPPEDLERLKSHFKSLTPANPVASIDHRIIMPDGNVRWQRWSDRVIFDNTGNIVEYQSVGRDITDQKLAEKRAGEYTKGMEILSKSAMDFIETDEKEDIYHKIAKGTKLFFPEAVIVIHSYHKDTRRFLVRCVLDEPAREKIARIVGGDPIGMSYTISNRPRTNLMSRELVKIDNSLYEAINRSFTGEQCQEIEKSIGIRGIYVIGLAWGDELFGRVSILTSQPELPGKEIFETFIRQSSIALQKWFAETARKDSEERFRSIAEFSPFPISIIDSQGNVIYLNNRFSEVFGYGKDEISTIYDWQNLAYPDDLVREGIEATRQQWLRTSDIGQVMETEANVRCRDGSSRDLMIRAVSMSGGIQFIIYEDVTYRLQTEKIRAFHASIVESADMAIVGKTLDGTIISWNKGAERMYGYAKEEITGKSMDILVPGKYREEIEEIFQKVAKGISIERIETVWQKKDGSLIDVALTVSPILDDGGTIVGISTLARDITQKKINERDLHVKEYAIESSVIGIGISDLSGRLTYANRAFLRMFGYQEFKEVKNSPLTFFAHNDEREMNLASEVLESLKTKGSWTGEIRPVRKDGTAFDAQLFACTVTDSDGTPLCLMATFTDISVRKQAEHDLYLKESAMEFSQSGLAIVDLVGNLIHANMAFVKMLGYNSLNEIIYQPVDHFANNRQEILSWMRAMKTALKNEGKWEGEVVISKKDGTIADVFISAIQIANSSKKTLYTVISCSDITETMKLRRNLEILSNEVQLLIDAFENPACLVDKENHIITWNRALEELSGLSGEAKEMKEGYLKIFSEYGSAGPPLALYFEIPEEELGAKFPYLSKVGKTICYRPDHDPWPDSKRGFVFSVAIPIEEPGGNRTGALHYVKYASGNCIEPPRRQKL